MARFGSTQLDNELARLGSLSYRARSQARARLDPELAQIKLTEAEQNVRRARGGARHACPSARHRSQAEREAAAAARSHGTSAAKVARATDHSVEASGKGGERGGR